MLSYVEGLPRRTSRASGEPISGRIESSLKCSGLPARGVSGGDVSQLGEPETKSVAAFTEHSGHTRQSAISGCWGSPESVMLLRRFLPVVVLIVVSLSACSDSERLRETFGPRDSDRSERAPNR